jgi:hypothetical protein
VVTAPTCTEEGYTTHTCTCGDVKTDSKIPATGHTYTAVVTKPTCTEEGYTTHTCACGDVKMDTPTPALDHAYDAWKITKQPTYTETGTEQRDCTRCEHTEERTLPKKPLPDAFSVKADDKDVTSDFKKNGHEVDGKVPYTVTRLMVSITEYGVNNTITFNFNEADGIKISEGVRYTFTLPIVHEVDGALITDYYTIRVVQIPVPVSSQPESSSDPSSEPEPPVSSELPESSQEPDSSEPTTSAPSSEPTTSVPESSETPSEKPVASQKDAFKQTGWMMPVSKVMGALSIIGILYVAWQLLRAYGLAGWKKQPDTSDADHMVDMFRQEQPENDGDLDEIFHNKK